MNKIEMYGITPLMPEQALELIKAAADHGVESGHEEADEALCGLLVHLGFTDIVEKYLKIPKWYA